MFLRFPHFSDGQLSLVKNHLVSANYLINSANRLNLGQYLQLGAGEETTGGRTKQRLLVNTFEAVLAAVYLDGGMAATRAILERYIFASDNVIAELSGGDPPQDFRVQLERLARDRNLGRPQYAVRGETGPGHAKIFEVEVRVGPNYVAAAEASSRKVAAHKAAQEVCRLIRGSGRLNFGSRQIMLCTVTQASSEQRGNTYARPIRTYPAGRCEALASTPLLHWCC